jgi:hypothetical protein
MQLALIVGRRCTMFSCTIWGFFVYSDLSSLDIGRPPWRTLGTAILRTRGVSLNRSFGQAPLLRRLAVRRGGQIRS